MRTATSTTKHFKRTSNFPQTSGLYRPGPNTSATNSAASFSGPIKKDKTFFLVCVRPHQVIGFYDQCEQFRSHYRRPRVSARQCKWQWFQAARQFRSRSSRPTLRSLPNAPCKNIDSTRFLYRRGYGLLGKRSAKTLWGCLNFTDPQTDSENIYYGRVDHNFSSRGSGQCGCKHIPTVLRGSIWGWARSQQKGPSMAPPTITFIT